MQYHAVSWLREPMQLETSHIRLVFSPSISLNDIILYWQRKAENDTMWGEWDWGHYDSKPDLEWLKMSWCLSFSVCGVACMCGFLFLGTRE